MECPKLLTHTILADRIRFVQLWAGGMSARDIALVTGASMTTVYRWIHRWQREGNVYTRRHRHKPRLSRKANVPELVSSVKSKSDKTSAHVVSSPYVGRQPRILSYQLLRREAVRFLPSYSDSLKLIARIHDNYSR